MDLRDLIDRLPPAPELIKKSALAFLTALLFWIISNFESHVIRPPLQAPPEMSRDPLQTPTNAPPFVSRRGGEKYLIEPVADYEITGLVVELHDSDSWKDRVHALAKDFINTRDLCVVWGENLKNDVYRKVKFSHGEWTCYAQSSSSEVWRAFHMNQLSNNHVLPATEKISTELGKIEIGDQITLKGMLVNYERTAHPPGRHTSITREDTGDGACEIIWVTDFQLRHRAAKGWRNLRTLSMIVMIGSMMTLMGGIALGGARRD